MMRSAAVMLFLVACSGETTPPDNRASEILALTADPDAGMIAYESNCSFCHGDMGQGNPQSGSNVQGLAPEITVGAVLNPPEGMPDFNILENQGIADIAGYLEGL